MLIHQFRVKIKQKNQGNIHKQICSSRDAKKCSELIQQRLIERKNCYCTSSEHEYEKMQDIHLFAFEEVQSEQNEQHRSNNNHKLKK